MNSSYGRFGCGGCGPGQYGAFPGVSTAQTGAASGGAWLSQVGAQLAAYVPGGGGVSADLHANATELLLDDTARQNREAQESKAFWTKVAVGTLVVGGVYLATRGAKTRRNPGARVSYKGKGFSADVDSKELAAEQLAMAAAVGGTVLSVAPVPGGRGVGIPLATAGLGYFGLKVAGII